jgi:predicted TIM-barrel enzyme
MRVVLQDVASLQEGGVDSVLFTNEMDPISKIANNAQIVGWMAFLIGQAKFELKIPFGVEIRNEPLLTLDLAASTEANFLKISMGNSLFGINYLKFRRKIKKKIKFLNIGKPTILVFISAKRLTSFSQLDRFFNFLQSVVLCIPFDEVLAFKDRSHLNKIRLKYKVFIGSKVNLENIKQAQSVSDGVVVGTSMKVENLITNPVDYFKVKELMDKSKKEL